MHRGSVFVRSQYFIETIYLLGRDGVVKKKSMCLESERGERWIMYCVTMSRRVR